MPWFSFLHLIFLIIIQSPYISSAISDDQYYQTCGKTFSCGKNITGIGYPFRGFSDPEHCGHPNLILDCNTRKNTTNIEISGMKYRVLEIAQPTQTMTIAREDVMEENCPTEMKNTTLDYSVFEFATAYTNITFLYECIPGWILTNISNNISSADPFSCGNGNSAYVVPGNRGPGRICNDSVTVPTPGSEFPNATELVQTLRRGFPIRWKINGSQKCSGCTASKGRCGYDLAKNQTACYCSGPPFVNDTCLVSNINVTQPLPSPVPLPGPSSPENLPPETLPGPSSPETSHSKAPVSIGVVVGVVAFTILIIIIVVWYLKRWRSQTRRSQTSPSQVSNQDIENLLLQHGSLALKRYKYSEIKKMTKSFNDKLGRGGFGSVYKGVLPDGSLVAVKVLIETDSNGEEFINEVASISRTSHVNIVNLLGFCFDKNKRALVYEFMPNKSLDKFISSKECSIDLETLYKIAIGVAKGLEYLHTGCNSRIVHFDIKPQNILLDEDLCPKISDFGLAKLCKKKQSIISMIGARGTIGYIAPEIFSRNFGGASHKSDVYSYGMMILEMAGARKFDEVETTGQSSLNYFPDKIYEQVVLDVTMKLNDNHVIDDKEEIARKMFLIGFWCIQTVPSDRPQMSKVIEMLEGSIQSIRTPPKPFLFSPTLSGNGFSSSLSTYVELEHSVDGPI
ncbi:hypothetical protein ABFX02_12G030400 [Erythranthe guttata]